MWKSTAFDRAPLERRLDHTTTTGARFLTHEEHHASTFC